MDLRFAFRRYSLPFRAPVRNGHGIWPERQGLYVRIEDADGRVGFGEAAPVPGFGSETVDADEAFCAALGDTVDAGVLARIPAGLDSLRGALAVAGGRHQPAPRNASLGVAALLPAGVRALEESGPKADAGFRVFKWKVGVGDARDEMGILDDLLGRLPSGSRLRLDANGAWDRRTAERWLDRAAGLPVEFVEQPVSGGSQSSRDLLRGLAADYPTPIALDESIASDADVALWIDAGWQGFFVVKPSLLGDAAAALERLAAVNARVVFSSALETALGARSGLAFAFAWPGAACALGFGVWPLFSDPRFDGPFSGPFLHHADVERINPEALWNALN